MLAGELSRDREAKAKGAAFGAGRGRALEGLEDHVTLLRWNAGALIANLDLELQRQLLLVLEAMKMEHRIDAPWAGTIKSLNVAEGDQVANGAMLVVLEQAESQPS